MLQLVAVESDSHDEGPVWEDGFISFHGGGGREIAEDAYDVLCFYLLRISHPSLSQNFKRRGKRKKGEDTFRCLPACSWARLSPDMITETGMPRRVWPWMSKNGSQYLENWKVSNSIFGISRL